MVLIALAPHQPAPTIAIVINARDYSWRAVSQTRITADPGGVKMTDAEGRAAFYLDIGFRGTVEFDVRWSNGCTRHYSWLQSNGFGPQVLYVNAAECG